MNIEVKNEFNYTIIDIKKDCTLKEYGSYNNLKELNKEISFSTLFNVDEQLIKKKKIYIIKGKNIIYNIYSNNDIISINQKKYNNEDCYVDEKIIEIKVDEFKIIRQKHDKNLSTFYTKYFSSANPNEKYFHLEQKEALKIAKEVIEELGKIRYIEKIVDLMDINRIFEKRV